MQEILSEAERKELETQFVGAVSYAEPPSDSSSASAAQSAIQQPEGTTHAYAKIVNRDGSILETVDVWILPLEEMHRIESIRNRLQHAPHTGDDVQLQISDLDRRVRDVAGELMLSANASQTRQHPSSFILTPTLRPSVNCLAQSLAHRLPVLLSGPASCGKSSMIDHLWSLLQGQQGESPIVTLQLGDHSSLDAKALIGTYTSSPTNPGSFDWVEGALTKAVRTGKWLVLDDIDKAAGEILSVIKPLVEAMGHNKHLGCLPELDLGTRGKVVAAPTFALFATRSTQPTKARNSLSVHSPATFLGHNHWTEVVCDAANEEDVAQILAQSFPRLTSQSNADSISRFVAAWRALQSATQSVSAKQQAAGSRRVPTLRDLIKWCRRVDEFLGDASGNGIFDDQHKLERAFIEGAEVFLGSIPPPVSLSINSEGRPASLYESQIHAFASALGLSVDRARWTLDSRTPEIRGLGDAIDAEGLTGQKVRIGRVELRRQVQAGAAPIARNFAMTKPAATLLERIAASTALAEPVLLVGETGTGKTTCVQHLASLLGRPMVALNLSQQTEASDLLGSFKPLEPRIPATDLHNTWHDLFERTFSAKRNPRFVDFERKALRSGKWPRLVQLWQESIRMADERRDRKLKQLQAQADASMDIASTLAASNKKRKTQRGSTPGSPSTSEMDAEKTLDALWQRFAADVSTFAIQHASGKKNFVFSFVEGPLVKALREGAWVLLDEINLAASETLDSLASLLQSPDSSVTLFERGDVEPIPRHPNFRLFACMNPATDVGKKDLPVNLRTRFTELYVQSPDADREALVAIVQKYIGHLAAGDRSVVLDVAESYAEIRRMAGEHLLADGANQRPHFSIRTLSRALTFAADQAATFGLRRAIWEGFIMAFTLLLDDKSAVSVRALLQQNILSRARNANQIMKFEPPMPKNASDDDSYVKIGPFWLQSGPEPLGSADEYVLTESVLAKLIGLARAILARKSPVLIQGPTSAGKTSAVEYLARRTGHRFVRINNHEHTDVQEYLGSYASDPDTGRLVFHEGLLVKALRRGDWIVLDELNLAPTDVLEALNRLLDDNRELVIPETGEVVKPHPNFMLFATQNPPGIYAGRKVLSRAFRNRFLELHFDDVPRNELEIILTNRCAIPPSYAAKVVAVFVELQKRRQAGRVFDTKQAFVTLRDLFRWGQRKAQGYQQLAENGYMLIAERARRADDKAVVREVIEDVMKVKIDTDRLYDLRGTGLSAIADRIGQDKLDALLQASERSGLVWTSAMQRLLCLVAFSLRYDEPVLLVGETGAGKTSVCEALAQAFGSRLHTVNCHQNTDTADLLGGQRPLRNRGSLQAKARARSIAILQKTGQHYIAEDIDMGELSMLLSSSISRSSADDSFRQELQAALQDVNQAAALFEWRDGPLVEAMRGGDHLLLDEISLADDSVLERLNSVLEPGRTLVLAERSGASSRSEESLDAVQLRAQQGFQVVATMNPGGDYGKKELSPALRNRFTEIYVPQVDDRDDILQIFEARWADAKLIFWGPKILDFVDWFADEVGGKDHAGIGLRDLLSWITFMNTTVASSTLSAAEAYAHGALLAFVDGIGALPATATMTTTGLAVLRQKCLQRLREACGTDGAVELQHTAAKDAGAFCIGPFAVPWGSAPSCEADAFDFKAPTTANNALKVLRGLYVLGKAVLLEGSPGAGKTSLISALAKASGHRLTRINLSDQTELVDLFGADLPVEGGGPGEFAWKDAAFLRAMQNGEWVLLDEMNLASQSVLEGLNSCLDHRGSVYIPELGRSFDKHPDFRLFAAQNPQQQGGGRKGLPKSFLNRFTKVHVDELQAGDILNICAHLYPHFQQDDLAKMIRFNALLHEEVMVKHSFGRQGAPWEFNLRDLLRWLVLVHSNLGLNWAHKPIDHLGALYIQRFRTNSDRVAAATLFEHCFNVTYDPFSRPWPTVLPDKLQFGHVLLDRKHAAVHTTQRFHLLDEHLAALEGLADCVRLQWLSILVGPAGVGKSSLIRMLAQLSGVHLEEMRMSGGVDTMDVLGTFEQVDPRRALRQKLTETSKILRDLPSHALSSEQFATLAQCRDMVRACHNALAAGVKQGIPVSDLASELQILAATSTVSTEVRTSLLHLATFLSQDQSANVSAAGRFEWNDGPLVRAMQEGTWLLLDDANICSASVLDRLNSLFEPGGSLLLSERGVVSGEIPEVRPHPNFRLFMAIDPAHGELSRAMRNRGLEISIPSPRDATCHQDERAIADRWHHATRHNLPLSYSELAAAERFAAVMTTSGSMAARYEWITKSVPEICVPLMSHVVPISSNPLVQLAGFWQSVGVASRSSTFKTQWSRERGVDGSFLAQQGPDVGSNPNLWDADSGQASALRLFLQVVSGAFAFNSDLLQAARTPEDNDGQHKALSLLQQSAMVTSIRAGDSEGKQCMRMMFPLLQSAGSWLVTSALQRDGSSDTLVLLLKLLALLRFLLDICKDETFDYSAGMLVVADVRTTITALESLNVLLDEQTSALITAVHQQVKLTAGFAMREVWQLCIPARAFAEASGLAEQIMNLVHKQRATDGDPNQALSAIDLLATLALHHEGWSEAHKADALNLAQAVTLSLNDSMSGGSKSRPSIRTSQQSWEVPATASLQLLSQHLVKFSSAGHAAAWYNEAIKQLLACHSQPIRNAVSLRQTSWSAPADHPVSFASAFQWADVLCSKADGGEIFRPFLLLAAAGPPAVSRVSLAALSEHRRQCDRLGRIAILSRSQVAPLRTSAMREDLIRFSLDVLRGLGAAQDLQWSSDDSTMQSRLQTCKTQLSDPTDGSPMSTEQRKRELLLRLISTLEALLDRPKDDLVAAGQAYVSAASAFLDLYLPNIAIDPLASMRTEAAFGASQISAIRERLDVAVFAHSLVSESTLSPQIEELKRQLEETTATISGKQDRIEIDRVPDLAILARFFQGVHSFTRQVLTPDVFHNLIEHVMHNCDAQAMAREDSLQQSMLNFKQRMQDEFAAIKDLVSPIMIAVTMYQVGLRSILSARIQQDAAASHKKNASIIKALATFPSTASTAAFCKLDLPIRVKAGSSQSSQAVSMLLAVTAALCQDAADGRSMSDILRPLSRAYDQLFYIWSLDRERERQEQEEANSLFKSRGEDVEDLDDEKAIEAEFRSMFPEFGDVMDDNEGPHGQPNGVPAGTSKRSFTSESIQALSSLHLAIFTNQKACLSQDYGALRNQLLKHLLQRSYPYLSEDLDQNSAALQLTLLAAEAGFVQHGRTSNFYLDPNVDETSKATRIVEDLRVRLTELIREWPDQMVLQHILDRCDAILHLDSQSAVAKILAALEQLLVHTEDWEGFANSTNSLSDHRSKISAQIIAWRRLELNSWSRLLETQSTLFSQQVAEWWFRLYEVAVRGWQSAVGESEAQAAEHLRSLISLLDQYIRSSNIGQFESRLQLVAAFAKYLELLTQHAPSEDTKGLDQVARVFFNATAFYEFYKPVIRSSLDKEHGKIEKEIRDYIQLASWRDVNIHALKQSAQKSHRKLHRCVRRFRDVLRQPVDPILAASPDDGSDVTRLASGTASRVASMSQIEAEQLLTKKSDAKEEVSTTIAKAVHLQNLARTYKVLRSVTEDGARRLFASQHDQSLDELAVTIVTESEALAKATPALATEENQKTIKQLTNQKRKAWTDLLREMKRIGLTPLVNESVVAQNCDPAMVFQQPSMRGEEVASVQDYFYRILKVLPKMRDSLHTAQGDVPMSELQRGSSYCEHATSIIFTERQRIANVLHSSRALQAVVTRLTSLAKQIPSVRVCSSDNTSSVFELATSIQRIAVALSEILAAAPAHIHLSPISSANIAELTDQIKSMQSKATGLSEQLSSLARDLKATRSICWTEAEGALVSEALSVMDSTRQALFSGASAHVEIEAMCVATAEWISTLRGHCSRAFDRQSHFKPPANDVTIAGDRLINSILQIAQNVRQAADSDLPDLEALADKAVPSDIGRMLMVQKTLRFEDIWAQIEDVLRAQEGATQDCVVGELSRVVPFIAEYASWMSAHADSALRWQRSLLKLVYCMSKTVTSLASKGFCKPPEQDDSQGDDAGEGQELEGGTGLGDGSGAKDITDQMEDDETVEELQKNEDQDESGEKGETEREKGAREADEDIDGNLEEVSADENEDEADDDEQQEEQDIDDHVGDVDPLDANAVDEKMWSGEQEEKQDESDKGQTDKDLGGETGENEDSAQQETAAEGGDAPNEAAGDRKDTNAADSGNDETQDDAGSDNDPPHNEAEGESEQDQQTEGEDGEIQPEEDAGAEQDGSGRKLDPQTEAGENLDLDEDLKMSDAEGEGSDEEDGMDDGMDLPDEPDSEQPSDDSPADERADLSKVPDEGDPQQDLQQSEDEVNKNKGEDAREDDDDDDDAMSESKDPTEEDVGAAESSSTDGMQNQQDGTMDADEHPMDEAQADSQPAGDLTSSADQAQGRQAQQGRQTRASKPEATETSSAQEHSSSHQEESMDAPSANEQEQNGGTAQGGADDQSSHQQPDEAQESADDGTQPNPVRSLGDALKEFRKNIESIAEASTKGKEEDGDHGREADEGVPETGDVEHVVDDEDAEMQAMGAADQEEVNQKLPGPAERDDAQEGAAQPPDVDQAEEMPADQAARELKPAALPDFEQEETDRQRQGGLDGAAQSKKALLPSDIQTDQDSDRVEASDPSDVRMEEDVLDGDLEEEQIDPLPETERSEADEAVEEQLAHFRAGAEEDRLSKAADLWRSYTTLTSDLAFALCEQLRLILTPTLAARLNGDFRTGKRLNMRKIVPFIASDFAKDKIWLRRTKPSKREYQVLLALDDSRSMAENRSVHLAYQTLALVSGAMSRLEVGDVSICRFGESVQTLHPFGKGNFADDSGARVLEKLSFEQKGTNMVRLVEHTLNSLQEARESRCTSSGSSAAELWQLEIIISDGVCQDHEKLRSLLRRANEQRVMIVFIIVDSAAQSKSASGDQKPLPARSGPSNNSILSMSSVRYETDPTTGRMELKMDRYLDSFPFSYYVVLREAEALPDVLATTLRQWAEKIRQAE